MAHPRETIRKNIVTVLSGNTVAGTNVFPSRVKKYAASELPGIAVYTMPEVSSKSGGLLERVVKVAIHATLLATSGIDDDMDDIAEVIEDLMAAAPTLTGIAEEHELTATDVQISEDGEKSLATLILTFDVTYLTE